MRKAAKIVFVGACVGLAAILSVVGFVFLIQVQGLKTEQAKLDRELAAVNGQVTELEKVVRQIASGQPDAAASKKNANSVKTLLSLGDAEMQLVRQFIRVAPRQANAQTGLKVGDALPQSASLPIPQALVDKVPKLDGARFAIDQSGAIAISGAGDDRVAVVIPGASLPAAN